MEASLHFLAPELLALQMTGNAPTRNGNRSRDAVPQGVYPCAGQDEWCAIAVEDDEQWQALRQVLGDPNWMSAAELDSVGGRLATHDRIDEALSAWTCERKPRDVMNELTAAGIPAGHVQRSRDLESDPQLLHRGFHRELDHAEIGRVPYSGHQFRVSGYDNGPRFAAPLLGGESFEILSEELGMDAEVIADLMSAGTIS
jgi:crotonobetainyl-CoA:carnitine CoA-transferase CaiB-like acyl-CoA transferase